jgi:general secretion pathway protein L
MGIATDTMSRFFAWWFGELAACVPDRVRRFFRRPPAALMITPTDGRVAFTLHRNGQSRDLGSVTRDAQEPRLALARLARGISLRDLDVVVALPADSVPRRKVTLPLVAQENLREVLGFELDRHTPFRVGDVAFDYRVTETDPDGGRLGVDLAIVPRDLLEEASGLAKSFGLPVDRIGIAGEDFEEDRPFDFLPRGDRASSPAIQQRLVTALALAVAVLAVVAAYLPLYAKDRELAARQAMLAESRTTAREAEALKTLLAARLERGRFLIDRRLATPPAISLVAEVSEHLPDDSWLQQVRWHGNALALSGFSPAAAALIEGLEESPLLSEVQFASPVTKDPRVERERFNISAEVAAAGDR